MPHDLTATIVFDKHWKAIDERNSDGSRKYRYIIHRGSSRSSKTRSLITSHYLEGLRNKNWRISVWRSTKKDCKDTVGRDMQTVYPELPFSEMVLFNKTETIYQFTTGSVIELNGTDEPNKVHGYNGDVAHLNEPYDMSKDTFDQIDMRTSEYLTIDLNPKEGHWSDDLEKDPRCLVIHSTFLDNPFCPHEQKIKILSYQPVKLCTIVNNKIMSEGEAKEYDIVKNTKKIEQKLLTELQRCKNNEHINTASAYNWSVYGLGLKAEKPNRIFFWNECSYDVYDALEAKKYYGVDWGTVDPWGVLEAKYYDGALYLHELNYKSENQIKEDMPTNELIAVGQDIEGGIVKWLFGRLNVEKKNYIVCDTNRPLKIEALWSMGYDYATQAPKPQGSIIDGINILSNMKVYFTSSSANIRAEQENYSRIIDRYGIVLEEPEDKNNHLIDPARYIAIFLRLMGIIK